MVDVHLIAGFLGAGKTTAVRHLLRHLPSAERVAVVVNDFGEARVDPAMLDGERAIVREIAGGCVCCTAPAGFVAAVGGLLDQVDRIVVEPTGLARPADLIDTLRRAPYADRLRLGPLVVLVDPHLLATDQIPADALAQAALADVLVANRVDRATPDELDRFRAWTAAAWPGPLAVHEVAWGQVPVDVLRWPAQPRRQAMRILGDAPAHPYAARSWTWGPEERFDRDQLLAAFARPMVRAKGVVRSDVGTLDLQQAGGVVHEARSDWRRDTRVDAIVAADRAADLDAFGADLEAARLDPATHSAGTTLDVGGRTFDRAALAALPDGLPDVGALVPGRVGAAARVREVLRAAGIDAARWAVVARDGLTPPPTTRDELDQAVLVHSLGDGPLPDPQGGPFRLLIPGGADACANVKGVVRLAPIG
ncbi:MAG: GTP-binding protein [Myxococcota bacterium]